MFRKLRKTSALAASLALAGATISGSASAQHPEWQSAEECYQYVQNGCSANWQRWGYAQESDCVMGQWCLLCMQGYMCGILSYEVDWAVKPETADPW